MSLTVLDNSSTAFRVLVTQTMRWSLSTCQCSDVYISEATYREAWEISTFRTTASFFTFFPANILDGRDEREAIPLLECSDILGGVRAELLVWYFNQDVIRDHDCLAVNDAPDGNVSEGN
jgi:hypothetical protein